MAKHQNAVLVAFEAKIRREMMDEFQRTLAEHDAQKEAEFQQWLDKLRELCQIAMLIAGNDLGILAEKRAGPMLEEHMDVLVRMTDDLLEDAESDRDLVYTIYDLASRVKSILGREGWAKHQKLFLLLRDYWDEEGPND